MESWPALPVDSWRPTYKTLHMWTQIVGKIRMTLSPPLNHWWHVTLYVSPRGLTTGPIPYGLDIFEIEFDFRRHHLRIETSAGQQHIRPLLPESVADFYHGILEELASLGISVSISSKPQEVADPVPFERDRANCSYDPDAARAFWRILASSRNVFERFRSRFVGKCSPTHFFWGSFDLACTRFSGRLAPPRKGAISGPAYSHEVSSAGFWPGGGDGVGPLFYAYTVPVPPGIEQARIRPDAARWDPGLSEFVLMYDDMRKAASPEGALYEFIESAYEAGATRGGWDRAALEMQNA
jgi:hypothetical protein